MERVHGFFAELFDDFFDEFLEEPPAADDSLFEQFKLIMRRWMYCTWLNGTFPFGFHNLTSFIIYAQSWAEMHMIIVAAELIEEQLGYDLLYWANSRFTSFDPFCMD